MDLSDAKNIVIIGGGQAGAQACASLRQWGYEGAIDFVCEEPALPYQRPPLSKAYMKGEFEKDRLFFKTTDWYTENNITLHMSTKASRIDRSALSVQLEGGRALPYDAMILSTGSRPRKLPMDNADAPNVFDLRSIDDVDQMKPHMIAGQKLVIVGAGYIGLEAAAVARQMGLDVTVLEMADRVLARVTSPVISEFYETQHRAEGVDIKCGARLSGLIADNGKVIAAELEGSEKISADIVLIGIGILPNIELAEEAGIACSNGILVDEDARTNDPRIFAAGDCAARPLVHYGRRGRLESVHNAIEQGKLAAAAIVGRDRPKEDCPWFWSDQYDLKLQIAGLNQGYDQVVVRGEPEARKFAAFYLKSGRLIAVDAVNAAPEFLVAKKLIIAGASIAPEVLSNTSTSMKEIAAMAAA